jgi:poly(A) polymerase
MHRKNVDAQMPSPDAQRRFAVEIVRRLRAAGFTAYWAGGCVRDQLLGRTPKDYDVATNATPDEIRDLFGRRRTLAVGAAFGVIAVVGPRAAGTVETATFRRDAEYSDGRHPDAVAFSSPEEDASRRDFTINGLFYDPIEEKVIDFVGGQADLAARRLRAIGNPRHRFAEDKLRMLRAVRFAATYDFILDPDAKEAIREMAHEIGVVSPERIAEEMRRMLVDAGRAKGVRLMLETGLAAVLLSEIVPRDDAGQKRLDAVLEQLSRLGGHCGFPLALAVLLGKFVDDKAADDICRRWRLSNFERQRVCWLVAHQESLISARNMPWSMLQPLLVHRGAVDLMRLTAAASAAGREVADYCRQLRDRPRSELDPPPLLTGDDLLAAGVPAGPIYKQLLQQARNAQLDGLIRTKEEALAMVAKWKGISGF